jgi:hypothetical protein
LNTDDTDLKDVHGLVFLSVLIRLICVIRVPVFFEHG